MNIHKRLLLLVLAVWLPAAAGFALLSRGIYLREEAAVHEDITDLANTQIGLIERELDARAAVARAFAKSRAVRQGDIARFYEDAVRVADGTGDWIVLVDEQHILVNTHAPMSQMPMERPIGTRPPITDFSGAHFIAHPRTSNRAALFVMAPVERDGGPLRNVSVGFHPEVLQRVIEAHDGPQGTNVAVVDQNNTVVARSRDPDKWIGSQATQRLREHILSGEPGFVRLTTLDGVSSIGYTMPVSHYGWTLVVTVPQEVLETAARRAAVNACVASGILLLLGLAAAGYAARRISRSIQDMSKAAAELEQNRVPARLSTRVAEIDEVGEALHRAGLRSSESTALLEQRVHEAVEVARLAQEKSFESQKHEAIGRITGGLAHDFNNLLQTISMGLQIMGKTASEGRQRRVVDAGLQACSKASDLVRHMLAFGRTQPFKPRATALHDFALKVRELAGKAVGERIRLSVEIQPELRPVLVDPVQMELALLNLIFNARDAMSVGGGITVVGRAASGEDVPAGVALDGFACLDVIDEGHGMDPDTLARVLEPYFTTKPVGLGSGLGLAQVHSFARQSGGTLRLSSTPGVGTRITLTLPTCAEPTTATSPSIGRAAYRPLKILMVEDDPLVSTVVVPALQSAGHDVTLCVTADDARRQLEQSQNLDVVFTDAVMPGEMSGLDLAHWCRQRFPELGVVAATGYTTQLALKDLAVLKKPYALEDVLDALEAAMKARETALA